MSEDLNTEDVFSPLSPDEMADAERRDRDGRSEEAQAIVSPVPADAPEPPLWHSVHGQPTMIWPYRDANGAVLGYVCRFDPPNERKQFVPLTLWRGKQGLFWRWKSWPKPRPLYGLDHLAANPMTRVVVVEGEKCVDAARKVFPKSVVVTSPGGAEAGHTADWSALAGRSVHFWPDADPAGLKYASVVAGMLATAGAADISIVDAMVLAAHTHEGQARDPLVGWDVADAVDEGWDPEALRLRVLELASPWTGPEPARDEAGDPFATITSDPNLKAALRRLMDLKPGDYALQRKAEAKALNIPVAALDGFIRKLRGVEHEEENQRAQRDILLELVGDAELWRDPAGEAYATVREGGCRKTFRVRSGDFRSWLIRCWIEHFDDGGLVSAPGGQGLQDAISAVDAKAGQGPMHTPFVRIGHSAERVYVDLGDESWRAVEIDAEGWRIIQDVPVRLVRPSGMLPLPQPVREQGLAALLMLLPDAADAKDAKTLLLSFLAGVFMPHGSLPLLALSGRQGSGKSILTKRLRALIDPNQAPARQRPRTEEDLIIAASNGALVAFDNLSHINADLSDALCRLATGAGFSKRRLYTDCDEVIVQVRRPVIVNGITDLIRMPDLADRALFVELSARSCFAPESELETSFERDRPAMLGVLYDAVAAALRGYADEKASMGIRLADFERWARAAGPCLGLAPDEISMALGDNRVMGDRMLIDDDMVASLILKMLETRSVLSGTATDLLRRLREQADKGDERHLPKGPRALSRHLKRFVPAFERIGITLEQSKAGRDRQRLWTVCRTLERTVMEEF
jgi:hypothetical protein